MQIRIINLQKKLKYIQAVSPELDDDNFNESNINESNSEDIPKVCENPKESEEKPTLANLLKNIQLVIREEIYPQLEHLSYYEHKADENTYGLAYHSAAFIALRYNLTDFIGNSYDAGATEFIISIPADSQLIKGRVAITLSDNGKGFPTTMLPNQGIQENQYGKNYSEILNGNSSIPSDKVSGFGHGGAGLGLARISLFLEENKGGIYMRQNDLGPGAKITLESPQPISTHELLVCNLKKHLGKIKNVQIRKICIEEEKNYKKAKIIHTFNPDRDTSLPLNDSPKLFLQSENIDSLSFFHWTKVIKVPNEEASPRLKRGLTISPHSTSSIINPK